MVLKRIVPGFILLAGALYLLSSCTKDPGTGGLATITGKVYAYDVNKFGDRLDSGYIADTRVFISYGNHTIADDDTRTSFTGEYAFNWLQKGEYNVWVINQCDTCALLQGYDLQKVVIDDRDETVVVRDLINLY